MQDVGKEKMLHVHFLHVYSEVEHLGQQPRGSVSHVPQPVRLAAQLRGTSQYASEFTHMKWRIRRQCPYM